jgi:hypothetical protein
MTRDSGSGRHGEDLRSKAECEAPQSGGCKPHRPHYFEPTIKRVGDLVLTSRGFEEVRL